MELRKKGCIVAAAVSVILGLVAYRAMFSLGSEIGYTSAGVEAEARAESQVYCDLVQDAIAPSLCDYYKQVWGNLAFGEAAFDPPEVMTRGEPVIVTFAVRREGAASSLPEILGATPSEPVEIRIGGRMVAELDGVGFQIDPDGPVSKALGPGGAQSWSWNVTPTRASRHELVLKAFVEVAAPGSEGQQTLVRTFRREIPVEVTWGQRASDFFGDSIAWFTLGTNWLKALAGLLIAAFGVWAIIRHRGEPPPAK